MFMLIARLFYERPRFIEAYVASFSLSYVEVERKLTGTEHNWRVKVYQLSYFLMLV